MILNIALYWNVFSNFKYRSPPPSNTQPIWDNQAYPPSNTQPIWDNQAYPPSDQTRIPQHRESRNQYGDIV